MSGVQRKRIKDTMQKEADRIVKEFLHFVYSQSFLSRLKFALVIMRQK